MRGLADAEPQAADGAGAAHGRRAAQPQRRGFRAAVQATDAVAARLRSSTARAIQRALAFVAGNDHFFLNISMAACKAMSDAAHGVPGSSMVTVMARNGVNFGIRLSGTGDQWFQAPANPVDGLYFPGYTRRRCRRRPGRLGDHRDQRPRRLRDGGVAGDRPVRRRHTGRRDREQPADAVDHARNATRRSRCRRSTSAARRPASTLASSPTPACCRSSTPASRTRKAGVGQIGAGITTAPMECFSDALAALAETCRSRAGERIMTRTAVVAFGGNALVTDAEHDSIPQQYRHRRANGARIWSIWSSRAGGSSSRTATGRRSASSCAAPKSPSTRSTRCRSTTPWPTRRARSATCSSRR